MLCTMASWLETLFIIIMIHFLCLAVLLLFADTVSHSVGNWMLVSGKLLGATLISESSDCTNSFNRNGRMNKHGTSAPTRYRLLGLSQQGSPSPSSSVPTEVVIIPAKALRSSPMQKIFRRA